MPCYGPRRQPEVKARMVSYDPHETVRGMTQAVLDVRQATAWLGSRDEIDAGQLGVLGISLGGITAALAASAEPRLQNICLILAGGDGGRGVNLDVAAPQGAARATGRPPAAARKSLIELLKAVDPVTYAAQVRGRRILMLNAANDEVIPRSCTESLWQARRASRKSCEVKRKASHFSAAIHLFQGLARAATFFEQAETAKYCPREALISAAAIYTTAKLVLDGEVQVLLAHLQRQAHQSRHRLLTCISRSRGWQ